MSFDIEIEIDYVNDCHNGQLNVNHTFTPTPSIRKTVFLFWSQNNFPLIINIKLNTNSKDFIILSTFITNKNSISL